MPRIIPATCDNSGKVTADGVEVPEALVMSLGKQASSGILFIDQDQVFYFPSSATDIESSLAKISLALEKIAAILTSIGAGMTGPSTAPPPTLATDIATLNTIKGQVDTLKGALK